MYADRMTTGAIECEVDMLGADLRDAMAVGDPGRVFLLEERIVELETELGRRPSDRGRDILAALDDRVGTLTGDVTRAVVSSEKVQSNARAESAIVRSILLDMEKMGWVDRLDNQKPVCWIRTPAGTVVLAKH